MATNVPISEIDRGPTPQPDPYQPNVTPNTPGSKITGTDLLPPVNNIRPPVPLPISISALYDYHELTDAMSSLNFMGAGCSVAITGGQYRKFITVTIPGYTNANVTTLLGNLTSSISTTANATVSGLGGVRTPGRATTRVYGTSSSDITATTTLTNANFTVDNNVGSCLNASTGIFTAPVSGMYLTTLVLKVGTNNSLNQAAVIKNNSSSGNNIAAFWETDTNTNTATQFGTSGAIYLSAGDTLRVNVLAGAVAFDANSSWTVTFLG